MAGVVYDDSVMNITRDTDPYEAPQCIVDHGIINETPWNHARKHATHHRSATPVRSMSRSSGAIPDVGSLASREPRRPCRHRRRSRRPGRVREGVPAAAAVRLPLPPP